MVVGTLPENDLRRAFVAGAMWWQYHNTGATAWPDERQKAEEEAEIRYPGGSIEKQNPESLDG